MTIKEAIQSEQTLAEICEEYSKQDRPDAQEWADRSKNHAQYVKWFKELSRYKRNDPRYSTVFNG